uniref:Uncharacterized protein n=1 Tax=Panagrolaimus sp. ES5 TaxID=591445 RepID=A0AC34FCG8_9BILA
MLVGVYHAIAAKLRTVSHSQTAEFLTGGRKLPIIPVCLSLLTTFISEIRYDSVILRRIGSALFLVSTLFYMAVVMYAPSVALVGVTDVPLWPFILAVGAVSTVYTAIGGIKAVIWTDTLQAGFMYVGLGTLIIKGTIDAGKFWHF